MIGLFFLYDLLYTSFSSFKTEYIYEKQYKSYVFNPGIGFKDSRFHAERGIRRLMSPFIRLLFEKKQPRWKEISKDPGHFATC